MYQGRLFWDDEQRLLLLGLLLENVGVDRAIRLGDPSVWRAAIASWTARAGSAQYRTRFHRPWQWYRRWYHSLA